jgi:hypothetical protein
LNSDIDTSVKKAADTWHQLFHQGVTTDLPFSHAHTLSSASVYDTFILNCSDVHFIIF